MEPHKTLKPTEPTTSSSLRMGTLDSAVRALGQLGLTDGPDSPIRTPIPPGDIYGMSSSCSTLFTNLNNIHGLAEASFAAAHVLHERFDQWAQDLGVFAADAGFPHFSLDARLSHSESLRSLVVNYLKIVQDCLGKLISLREHSSETGQNTEMFEALESAVKGLYRLGVAIKESSASILTQKANAFIEKSDDGGLESILYLRLKHILVEKVRQQDGVGAEFSLCRQLASSVSFRYFSLLNRREHARKTRLGLVTKGTPGLEHGSRETKITQSNTGAENLESHHDGANTIGKPSALPRHMRRNAENHPPPSDTELSRPDSAKVRQTLDQPRPPSGALSVISESFQLPSVGYPPPPSIIGPEPDVECPYCCKLFLKSKFKPDSGRWWARHLDDDFKLYACISEVCAEPPQLFPGFREWKDHMDNEHGTNWLQNVHRRPTWCCETEHEPQWFIDEAEFETHVREKHPEEVPDEHALGSFKEWCEVRRSRKSNVCPVCNCVPESLAKITIQPSQANNESAHLREKLILHVAEHIKQVGFMSVAYLRDHDNGEDEGKSVGKQASLNPKSGQGSFYKEDWTANRGKLAVSTDNPRYLDPDYTYMDDCADEPPKANLDTTWSDVWQNVARLHQLEQHDPQRFVLAEKLHTSNYAQGGTRDGRVVAESNERNLNRTGEHEVAGSTGVGNSGRDRTSGSEYVTVWYCDNCRDGPHKILRDFCPVCSHQRCNHCYHDQGFGV
ncbi:hypothetical protein QBC44DRAFT_392682 [Cladorrhinum sp. PSN332]|nr:hypothetical protein QBC44DRAFT_392682 [Cladorrhinum sp. PSN332]